MMSMMILMTLGRIINMRRLVVILGGVLSLGVLALVIKNIYDKYSVKDTLYYSDIPEYDSEDEYIEDDFFI